MKGIIFNNKFRHDKYVFEGTKKRLTSNEFLSYKNRPLPPSELDYQEIIDNYAPYSDEPNYKRTMYTQMLLTRYNLKYEIGDVVAVKQSYEDIWNGMDDGDKKDSFREKYEKTKGWKNLLLTKNELMPVHIEITDIFLQHIQDIKYDDCIEEGIIKDYPVNDHGEPYAWLPYFYYDSESTENFSSPKEAFASMIDRIYGEGTWKDNGIKIVYRFKLRNRNESERIPWDTSKYNTGLYEVVTREWRPARILGTDIKSGMPIVAAVMSQNMSECIFEYNKHGMYSRDDTGWSESQYDLFLVKKN